MEPTVIQIRTFPDPDTGELAIYTLKLVANALFNLKARNQDVQNKQGEELVAGLIGLGAVLNDIVSPNGDLVPAVQYIDSVTGKPRTHLYLKDNNLQDPQPGVAAFQIFDTSTGKPVSHRHYKAGHLHDPYEQEPAVKDFDGLTGTMMFAASYFNGEYGFTLEDSELVELNRRRLGVDNLIDRLRLPHAFVL